MSDLTTIRTEFTEGSKAVEFLRVGTFRNSKGREVIISAEDMAEILANFEGGAAGQDVPIDIMHRRDEAAGWITGISMSGDRLLATVDWNELGTQLVGDRVYRYLSATIDTAKKVLISVSLVNFPAIKGLSPVELMELDPNQSLAEKADAILRAFRAQSRAASDGYGPEDWPFDIYEDYIVVERGDTYWRVDYSYANGTYTFDIDGMTKIKRAWVDAQAPEGKDTAEMGSKVEKETPAVKSNITDLGEAPITGASTGAAKPSDGNATPPKDDSPESTSAKPKAESEFTEAMKAQLAEFKDQIRAEFVKAEKERADALAQFMAEMRADQELTNFAESATVTGRHALPIAPDKLTAILKAIPGETRGEVIALLSAVRDNGLVDLGETGTSAGKTETGKTLDPSMRRALDRHVEDGGTVSEFFELNADLLGDESDYDL